MCSQQTKEYLTLQIGRSPLIALSFDHIFIIVSLGRNTKKLEIIKKRLISYACKDEKATLHELLDSDWLRRWVGKLKIL